MMGVANPGIIVGPRGGAPVLLRTFGSIVNVSSGDLALGLPSGGAGASGTISVSGLTSTGYHMVAIDFGWL